VPELIEVEAYRKAAEPLVGRRLEEVERLDPGVIRGGATPADIRAVVEGSTVAAVHRHGKLLLVELVDRPVLGLRFGMTGRLVVDDHAPIDDLEYGSSADRPEWDRFVVRTAPHGGFRINDPRRLGGVELSPDVARLGPDATTVTAKQLAAALDGSATSLKARLLDQSRVAGIGNLIADEVLWQARLAPGRRAGSLSADEVSTLARSIRASVRRLAALGGSHRGALQPVRKRGGPCPRCGATLLRSRIGGRTTLWCPAEQR
jgi:formamidopyrimidine-DNA glycosylase